MTGTGSNLVDGIILLATAALQAWTARELRTFRLEAKERDE